MKILAIVEDLRINKSSCGIISNNIVSCLLQAGHSITCLYDYADDKNFDWLQNSQITLKEMTCSNENLAIGKILKYFPRIDAILSYSLGYGYLELKKINDWKNTIKSHLRENQNYEVIILLGTGNAIFNYFAIAQLDIKIPFMVTYHDPYPESQYPEPYKRTYLYSKLKVKQSDKVMQKATIVSFPSQRLYEWMLQFHPILKGKSIIIPHPDAQLNNLPAVSQDDDIFLDNAKFNILHTGSLLGPRNPVYLLEAFHKFISFSSERKALTRLTIIGGISNKNELSKAIVSSSLESPVRVINGRISYKKSKELLRCADVLLIIEAISKDSPFMPGKITDYITADKIIMALTPPNSEVSRLLGEDYPYKTETDNVENIYLILENLWFKWKSNSLYVTDNKLKEYVNATNWNQQFMKAMENYYF
jgi:glycosyltransferase involved in cell wall biosynthesis